MAGVSLLNVVFVLVAILGAVRIMYFFRARAMRRFAGKWSLQYIGPTAPRQWWWNTSHLEVGPPVPAWISRFGITKIWNIIEGLNDGKPIIILDCIVGDFWSRPRTLIMCRTGQDPFATATSADRVLQTHGWTVLQGVWFLWFSWFIGIRRLDRHLSNLRAE
jgi:hypothetical protein